MLPQSPQSSLRTTFRLLDDTSDANTMKQLVGSSIDATWWDHEHNAVPSEVDTLKLAMEALPHYSQHLNDQLHDADSKTSVSEDFVQRISDVIWEAKKGKSKKRERSPISAFLLETAEESGARQDKKEVLAYVAQHSDLTKEEVVGELLEPLEPYSMATILIALIRMLRTLMKSNVKKARTESNEQEDAEEGNEEAEEAKEAEPFDCADLLERMYKTMDIPDAEAPVVLAQRPATTDELLNCSCNANGQRLALYHLLHAICIYDICKKDNRSTSFIAQQLGLSSQTKNLASHSFFRRLTAIRKLIVDERMHKLRYLHPGDELLDEIIEHNNDIASYLKEHPQGLARWRDEGEPNMYINVTNRNGDVVRCFNSIWFTQ